MSCCSVAVLGDGNAVDQFHHEVGPARVGGAGVEDLGDVGVVHQGQGLPLGLEAGDHLAGVHARLDDLQGHLAAHGRVLLGHVDDAHAAFADLLQELVGADDRAGSSAARGRDHRAGRRSRRGFEEAPGVVVGLQEGFDPLPQGRIVPTGLLEIRPRRSVRSMLPGQRRKINISCRSVIARCLQSSLPLKGSAYSGDGLRRELSRISEGTSLSGPVRSRPWIFEGARPGQTPRASRPFVARRREPRPACLTVSPAK